jgi:hypothetical protein
VTRARGAAALALALAACGTDEATIGKPDLAFPVSDFAAGCPAPSGLSSGWTQPNGPYWGVCTAADLDDFVAAVTQAGSQGLATFATTHAPCASCLGSADPSTMTGPRAFVTRPNGVLDPNVGGCVALIQGMSTAGSCGAYVQERDDCLAASCLNCGPIRFAADLAAYDHCLATAAQQECSFWSSQAACIDLDPAAAKCRSSAWPSTADWLRFLAELFCGSPGDL